jgi:uroporphyrinogen-III synthase
MTGRTCIILRPQPGAAETAARVAALGHVPLVLPATEIAATTVTLPTGPWQAVLVTSGHALRAMPVLDAQLLSVGDATAALARDLGWADVVSAAGDVEALTRLAQTRLKPELGRLLYPRGATVAGDLEGRLEAAGFEIEAPVVYAGRPAADFPNALRSTLQAGAGDILIHAPSAGRALAEAAAGVALDEWRAVCLSAAIAATIEGLDWQAVSIAAEPTEASLMEVLL